MNRLLAFLPVLLLLVSCCTTIRLGYNTNYNRLTEAQKAHVQLTSAPIDSLGYDRNVHVVSIEQVKNFLAAHDTTALLLWVPYHYAERSIPIVFEEECAARHISPIICLTSFFWEQMPLADSLATPLLFIDVRPYGTDIMPEYIWAVLKDLTELEWNPTEGFAQLKRQKYKLMFYRGRYIPMSEE